MLDFLYDLHVRIRMFFMYCTDYTSFLVSGLRAAYRDY